MDGAFRVIIVGGGPIGLLAAHCLSKAGIDFVLLERRDTLVTDSGGSIGVYPSTIRIFDQLGLFGPLQKIWSPLHRKLVITHEGVVYKDHPRFSWMKANHGHPFVMFHRAELLQCFYENLPDVDKRRILTNKRVVGIRIQDNGVEVRCSDGSVECGSVVIGADGVYSKVRQYIRQLAETSVPRPPLNEKTPYKASYKLFYGAAGVLPGVEHGSSWEAHGRSMSTQLFVGCNKMWFFWYEPLDSTTREKVAYTRDDQESFVKKWGHVHATDKIRLADIYAARISSGMTLVEEGMVHHWSWNRIVLVGDAAVKTTTNLAFGFNGGVQGLVALMNNLHGLASTKGDCSPSPSIDHFTRAFSGYQTDAMPPLAMFLSASSESTDMSVWRTWRHWATDRYVTGATNADRKMYHRKIGPILAKSFVLDYLEENNLPAGKIKWVHHPTVAKARL